MWDKFIAKTSPIYAFFFFFTEEGKECKQPADWTADAFMF